MNKPPSRPWRFKVAGLTKHSLARRLVIAIVLFSSFITLFNTGGQLYLEYRRDISLIDSSIQQVKTTYLQALASSLWDLDLDLVKIQLQGIVRIPGIEFLSVIDNNEPLVEVGSPVRQHAVRHEFPLSYQEGGQHYRLGKLVIEANLEGVYSRLRNRMVFILSTQATKTFLVSAFMYLLFYSLVGRHLTTMAGYARSFNLTNIGKPLRLNRSKPARKPHDELDDVESAINELRTNLILDMEERQKAKRKLKRSEARYRTLVENIPGTVYRRILQEPERMAFVSASIEKLTGSPQTSFLDGTTAYTDLIIEEDESAVHEALEASERNGNAYDVEYKIRDARDNLRIVHEYGTVVPGEQNKPAYADAVVFDVTARREIARKLDETNRLIQTLIEATSDAIFVKDPEGHYLLANNAALQAMGKSESEVIGKMDAELFPDASAAVIEAVDGKVLASGQTLISEEHLDTAYGETYWLSNKCPMRDGQGEVVGLIGISRNITETKKAEQEQEALKKRLQQAQKMEAIGTLAGGIAHDFNNILGIIMGYTEILRDEAPMGSAKIRELDQVMQACYRARDLVRQILAFSRQADTDPIPLQPVSSIKEGLKLLRATIPSTITLHEEIDPECGVIVIDPIQLHQVVMNLCTNAYQALENTGGNITITMQNWDVWQGDISQAPDLEGQFLKLEVYDNGPGIPEEIQDRIFEPYFTTKETGKGSGMGLAIVHGIVTGCGGVVTCSSRPGNGATFQALFPINAEMVVPKAASPDAPPMGQERVLYVDDEEALLELGTEMLEKLGYRVTAHASSMDALMAFQDQPDAFDLVLSDQTMPGMTGGDLSQQLLEIRPDIPIILCTGYSAVMREEEARAMGIRAYMMKPLDFHRLARLLREVLDGPQKGRQ